MNSACFGISDLHQGNQHPATTNDCTTVPEHLRGDQARSKKLNGEHGRVFYPLSTLLPTHSFAMSVAHLHCHDVKTQSSDPEWHISATTICRKIKIFKSKYNSHTHADMTDIHASQPGLILTTTGDCT